MTGINGAERRGDSGALSLCLLPSHFLLFYIPAILSTSASSLVHVLHFALSCCAVLLKLPRWPLYLQH